MNGPSTAASSFERSLRVLEEAGFRAMVVGAYATFAWGNPRTSRDLDVALLMDHGDALDVRAALTRLGAEPQGPFPTHGGMRFIVPLKEGLPLDVFLAAPARAIEFERRRRVTVEGVQMWMISPEDFVLTKLRNAKRWPEARAQDAIDALGVVAKQGPAFDRAYARSRCATLKVCEELEGALAEAGPS